MNSHTAIYSSGKPEQCQHTEHSNIIPEYQTPIPFAPNPDIPSFNPHATARIGDRRRTNCGELPFLPPLFFIPQRNNKLQTRSLQRAGVTFVLIGIPRSRMFPVRRARDFTVQVSLWSCAIKTQRMDCTYTAGRHQRTPQFQRYSNSLFSPVH